MKLLRPLLLLAVSCLSLRAAPANPGPLGSLAWIVGDWSAPASKEVHIDLKVEWAPNGKALRFDSAWVKGAKSAPYTSGLYAWNPVKKVLTITYADSKGTLAQGEITVNGTHFENAISMANEDGSVDQVKVTLTKDSDNQFTNDIQILKDGVWAPIAKVVYSRQTL